MYAANRLPQNRTEQNTVISAAALCGIGKKPTISEKGGICVES